MTAPGWHAALLEHPSLVEPPSLEPSLVPVSAPPVELLPSPPVLAPLLLVGAGAPPLVASLVAPLVAPVSPLVAVVGLVTPDPGSLKHPANPTTTPHTRPRIAMRRW
jgi:hypothetical protein